MNANIILLKINILQIYSDTFICVYLRILRHLRSFDSLNYTLPYSPIPPLFCLVLLSLSSEDFLTLTCLPELNR